MSKPALVIVQKFTYRGAPEEFSNKFHFTAQSPGSDANWKAAADALIAALRPCFPVGNTFVRAYGYNDGALPSVWSHDYTLPGPPLAGTFNGGSSQEAPGDVAAFSYWPTAKRNSRGKIVYARKYWHGVYIASTTQPDNLLGLQATAFQTLTTLLFNPGVTGMGPICLPDGTAVTAGGINGYLTTRTLKRRGKRPPT